MVNRGLFVLVLFAVLLVGVFFEQRFIDETCFLMQNQVEVLEKAIEENDLASSKKLCSDAKLFWENKEIVLSTMIDFKDIEKIGSQLTLVSAHLENEDFELAFVETKVLGHTIEVLKNTVCFDWQNII